MMLVIIACILNLISLLGGVQIGWVIPKSSTDVHNSNVHPISF
jgi:hypothetical protein